MDGGAFFLPFFLPYSRVMASKHLHTPALVLKRTASGEADRIVTLFTPEHGKMVAVAKGSRKLTSSQRSQLEPGNYIHAFCVQTKGMPILTQSKLLTDFRSLKTDLKQIRSLQQVLEIVDRLSVENSGEEDIFAQIIDLLHALETKTVGQQAVQDRLSLIIAQFGYPPLGETKYLTISDYVADITNRPLKSWEFLKV
jgi:recombinational DNA repair protein (RecF pathway)